MPVLPSGRSGASPAFDDPGNWSRVAFWAYVDGNVDLYTAMPTNAPAYPISRLTTGPASELQPAISPDATRMVYASDVDGDFDIYAVSYTHLAASIRPSSTPSAA